MNSLKSIVVCILLLGKSSFAQKLSPGIKAGLAFSNATIKQAVTDVNSTPFKSKTRTGVAFGVYLDIPFKTITVRPGAEIVSKGFIGVYETPNISSFVDLPVIILHKINYLNGHFIVGIGSTISIPLSAGYYMYPVKTEFGANGIFGYEISSGFSLNVNYSKGLSNGSRNKVLAQRITHRYFGISLGYSF